MLNAVTPARGLIALLFAAFLFLPVSGAKAKRYGESLCEHPDYHCVKVGYHTVKKPIKTRKGIVMRERRVRDTWENLFPDERERDIVKRVNRMNIRLWRGMTIAVPNDMDNATYMDYAPFPKKVGPKGEQYTPPRCDPKSEQVCKLFSVEECVETKKGKTTCVTKHRMICEQDCKPKEVVSCHSECKTEKVEKEGKKMVVFDPQQLAWAAYDEHGNLVRWGPAAGGANWCADIGRGCQTRAGEYEVINKRGRWAYSGTYPIREDGESGGAPVPYFMGFGYGYGIHASPEVPGRNASHGCIRVYYEDAEWLSKEFVEIGTRVIVKPYK